MEAEVIVIIRQCFPIFFNTTKDFGFGLAPFLNTKLLNLNSWPSLNIVLFSHHIRSLPDGKGLLVEYFRIGTKLASHVDHNY